MASPQLGVNNNPLMQLLAKLGSATGQDQTNPIDSLIRSMSGPKPTNSLTPVASPETIGAANGNLNNNLQQHYQNMFGMISADAANSLNWAQQAAAKRQAEEAQARQLALQKLLLQQQKNAASSYASTDSKGGNTSYSPTPNLNTVPTLKTEPPLKLPEAKPRVAPPRTPDTPTTRQGHPTKGGSPLEKIANRNDQRKRYGSK